MRVFFNRKFLLNLHFSLLQGGGASQRCNQANFGIGISCVFLHLKGRCWFDFLCDRLLSKGADKKWLKICLFFASSPLKEVDMGVSKDRGTPKWMVFIMEKPYEQMDDLGGFTTTIFGSTSIYQINVFTHKISGCFPEIFWSWGWV